MKYSNMPFWQYEMLKDWVAPPGSPGKNDTFETSIQRRLIITFIHSYYIVIISKVVVSIVCYRFIAIVATGYLLSSAWVWQVRKTTTGHG